LRAAGCPEDCRWAILGHEEETVGGGLRRRLFPCLCSGGGLTRSAFDRGLEGSHANVDAKKGPLEDSEAAVLPLKLRPRLTYSIKSGISLTFLGPNFRLASLCHRDVGLNIPPAFYRTAPITCGKALKQEHEPCQVGVEGSNPFARSKDLTCVQPVDIGNRTYLRHGLTTSCRTGCRGVLQEFSAPGRNIRDHSA